MSVGSAPGVGLGIGEFSRSAHAFLSERAERRSEQGPDDRSARQYSLFRASTVAEADVARAWQPMVSGGGFGWISGPVQYGGRGLPGAYERAYQAVERTCVTPQRPPRAVNDQALLNNSFESSFSQAFEAVAIAQSLSFPSDGVVDGHGFDRARSCGPDD
jgi:hypothetical protein